MSNKLFVGGLPYNLTDEQLGSHFAQAGQVLSAKVIKDKYSGQSKGFGFVEMATDEEAKQAIDQLNNSQVGTRTIIVNEARPQEERPSNRNYHNNGRGQNRDRRQNRY